MKMIVAGGSGQVGNEVLKLLANSEHSVYAFVRKLKTIRIESQNISEVMFNYDLEDYSEMFSQLKPDILICALGTTRKQAGSDEAFNQVDRDYPIKLMNAFKKQSPNGVFALVSSVGADQPRGLYLRAKFSVEKALMESGLKYIIVRPSLLMSERKEIRLGEMIAQKIFAKPYICLAEKFAPQQEQVWKFAPIEVSQVAKAMVRSLSSDRSCILEGLSLR